MKEHTDDDFNFRLPNNNSMLNAKKKEITWTGYKCNVCRNSGSKPGSSPFVKCPFCHNSNVEKFDSNSNRKLWESVNNDKCELKDLLRCPFCGGIVSKHPNKKHRGSYFVVYHDINCYMNDNNEPPFNFTLLPKNHCLKQWNRRIYHHF